MIDDSFSDGYTPGLTLAEWFSRPVKIQSYTWAANTYLDSTFNPWYDYFNNPEIKVKLKGFSRLQANLRLKVVINASPYHYGVGIMSYKPMSNAGLNGASSEYEFSGGHTDFILVGPSTGANIGVVQPTLMVNTCRPHTKFYAAASKGCEMQLPFCYYQNWINLDTDLDEIKQMGTITIYTPFELLDCSGNGANVSVTIYAWCEDFKVAGPSYVMQSGEDEYKSRPVSTAMSAMSKVASGLSYIPQIRPYAMATSSVLAGASNVARWFGFSNPPVISDISAFTPNYMANYASPEISVQQDKLALDPKNEVTVDSRTVGLDGVDHMSIAHIVSRDVDYEVLSWDSTQQVETPLLVHHVSPMVLFGRGYSGDTTTLDAAAIQLTPSAQIGTMFEFWSGTITYKFTVVASQFHRGRLMLTYEPDGFLQNYTSAAYTGPRTINKIWDISQDSTFEFEVPWIAPVAMLRTTGMPGVARYSLEPTATYPMGFSSTWAKNPTIPGNFQYLDALYNGSIVISVLNALTSNDPAYGVKIVCSVNCGGVEYFSPIDFNYPFSYYRLESGDDMATAPDEAVVHAEAPPVIEGPTKHVVYTGEIVRSIRQLLHRTCFYSRFYTVTPKQESKEEASWVPDIDFAADGYGTGYITDYSGSIYLPNLPYTTGRLPISRGADISCPYTGFLISDSSNGSGAASQMIVDQNMLIMTPTAYMTSSYVGWRGGTVYSARVQDNPTSENYAYGSIVALAISRVSSSISDYVKNVNLWRAVTWNIKRHDVQSAPANSSYAPDQCLNMADKSTRHVAHGLSGMAVTNPTKVDVVNAVVPYYSNLRMMPANAVCNYYVANVPDKIEWNKQTGADYPAGVNEMIQCPRVDFNVRAYSTLDGRDVDKMHSFDVFHKAGVDFTAFWYLNPPTLHFYKQNEGYPYNWS